MQGIADLGDVYGLEQPGDRAANATLAAALAKAPVPISNECVALYVWSKSSDKTYIATIHLIRCQQADAITHAQSSNAYQDI